MIILDEPNSFRQENKIIILKLLRDLAKNHNKIILFSSLTIGDWLKNLLIKFGLLMTKISKKVWKTFF